MSSEVVKTRRNIEEVEVTRRGFLKLAALAAAAVLGIGRSEVVEAALNPDADGGPTGGGRPPKEGEGESYVDERDRATSNLDTREGDEHPPREVEEEEKGFKFKDGEIIEYEVREDGTPTLVMADYKGEPHRIEFPVLEGTRVRWDEGLEVFVYEEEGTEKVVAVGYPVEIIRVGDEIEYDDRGFIKGGKLSPVIGFTDVGLRQIKDKIYIPKDPAEYTSAHVPLPIVLNPRGRWVIQEIEFEHPYNGMIDHRVVIWVKRRPEEWLYKPGEFPRGFGISVEGNRMPGGAYRRDYVNAEINTGFPPYPVVVLITGSEREGLFSSDKIHTWTLPEETRKGIRGLIAVTGVGVLGEMYPSPENSLERFMFNVGDKNVLAALWRN